MNVKLLSQVEKYIQDIILSHYKNTSINIFDEFVKMCQSYYDKPAHNFAELKIKNNTKLKGDIFEHFAYKYFRECYPDIQDVWLLKDLPEEFREKLSLKSSDLGIDLVARNNKGEFYAIQAKYRKKGYKLKTGISWKTLSTFYALCNRTGPYKRHIIITNADYVRHIGHKTKLDYSICIGTLKNITIDNWLKIANLQGHSLNNTTGTILDEPIPVKKKIIIRKKTDITTIIENKDVEPNIIKDINNNSDNNLIINNINDDKNLCNKSNLDNLRLKRVEYYEKILMNNSDNQN